MNIMDQDKASYVIVAAIAFLVIGFAVGIIINKLVDYLESNIEDVQVVEKSKTRKLMVQIFSGLMAVALLPYYQISLATITMFLLYCIIFTIGLIDADTQEIPPILNIAIAILGVISYFTISKDPDLVSRLIGVVCISLPLFIIIQIIPNGFGGGDIKMMAAVGLFLGWKGTVAAFAIGLVSGAAYGGYLLLANKADMKSHFALGPFLSAGIAISAYAGIGAELLEKYLQSMRFDAYDTAMIMLSFWN